MVPSWRIPARVGTAPTTEGVFVIKPRLDGVMFAVSRSHSQAMARSEFRVRMEGPVSVVEVRGPLDEAAARNLLEFVAAAARACSAIQVDLGGIESMTPEAAALILFRDAPWHAPGARISLRTNGQPGREAVLQAYARRRARP